MPKVVCKMWNMKCENPQHVQNNVTMQTAAVFASNLTANICLT